MEGVGEGIQFVQEEGVLQGPPTRPWQCQMELE